MVSELDPDMAYLVGLLFPDSSRQTSLNYGSLPVPDIPIREHIDRLPIAPQEASFALRVLTMQHASDIFMLH